MFRNALLISTLLVSSAALSGCSPIWAKIGDLSYSMAEFTKPAALRGLSKKSEESFDDTTVAENGVYKTPIGEYIPTEVTYDDEGNAIVDTSQHDCPEGTYLNEENACMFLETETFEFEDTFTVNNNQPVETGPVPCPDETYLTAENTCAYLENETFDFGDDLAAEFALPVETGPLPCPEDTYLTAENTCTYLETETFDFDDDLAAQVSLPIDTGPLPCPEDTYLTAENTCTYLETETFDFGVNTENETPVLDEVVFTPETDIEIPAPDSQDFAFNQPSECPEGFKRDAKNSCMYLGAELALK